MSNPKMKRASGSGVEIQLAEWGGRAGPVLCVHGLTANCRCWDTVASALAPKYKVLAMDLRGRGLSDKPRKGYSVGHHCRDILALLDNLKIKRATLMGHSLGAIICLAFTAHHPGRVEKLVLVDGAGKLTKAQTNSVFAGIKPSLERLGRVFPSFEAYTKLLKQAPFLKPWTKELDNYFSYEVEKMKGGVTPRTNPAHIQEEIMNLMKVNAAELYPRVKCPTLILRAPEGMLRKDDILLPKNAVKRMVAQIPEAWLVDIRDTNHYSIIFQRNKTRDRAIINFLES